MVCLICESNSLAKKDCGNGWIIMECSRCGANWLYDEEGELKLVDFDKGILMNYFLELLNKIKDENERHYLKGCFMCYIDAMYSDKKKVREWAIYKLADLIKKLQSL